MSVEGQYPKISVQALRGLNEREQYTNPNVEEFDQLEGMIPIFKNTLTQAPGHKFYANFSAPVLSICQTNDSRGNIIVQTDNNVYTVTEAELFNIVYVPTLTLTALDALEYMAYARILHKQLTGVGGGAVSTAWSQRSLTDIVSQINADGTAASFVTLAANQITLAIGVYRITGQFCIAKTLENTADEKTARVRLYNVSAALPAWSGLANSESDCFNLRDVRGNAFVTIGGHIQVTATPKIFEVQDIVGAAASGTNMTRGLPTSLGTAEVYGWLDILKSA